MSLITRFIDTRQYSEWLCEPLSSEDHQPQAAPFVSPPKWHLAHTSWFFEEMILKTYQPDYQPYKPEFKFLFNSYYNTLGDRLARPERGLISRPSVKEVYDYRRHITRQTKALLNNNPSQEIQTLVELGINHEQQHQELLITDLKYNFWHNPTHPVYRDDQHYCDINTTQGKDLEIASGLYQIGHDGETFCFDNEKGHHQVFLNDFTISSNLVSNAEYLAFIEDKGYQQHHLWLDDGWTWVNSNQIEAPLYWKKIDNTWYHYTLSGLRKVQPEHALTHVSFYEAQAFATWRGKRLPTEFEWEVASSQFSWGDRWEWTYSAYLPYPGFKISEGAVGEYNGKFMISQMVLRGASSATPNGHARHTYRNFFQPELRWQYNGIRLAS